MKPLRMISIELPIRKNPYLICLRRRITFWERIGRPCIMHGKMLVQMSLR